MVTSIEDVKSWLVQVGFGDYCGIFEENMIDGFALSCLTERALELLIPVIGHRMKFLQLLEKLKNPDPVEPVETIDVDATVNVGAVVDVEDGPDFQCTSASLAVNDEVEEDVNADEGPSHGSPVTQGATRGRKRCKRSVEAKRKQRLTRNKKKKIAHQQVKERPSIILDKLKEESQNLQSTIRVEKSIKEKYFEMWRMSENEKDKLKTSKMVLSGKCIFTAEKPTEILKVDPAFLEDIETQKILGKGRFGTVVLKKFRSSPVAVKYFESSSTPRMVEKEASHLQQCCHINLPIIYGMNNTKIPYFIVTQFYGNQDATSDSVTLGDIINGRAEVKFSGLEQWLHVISQLIDALCHLHQKKILHNDIKSDNILVIKNSGFYSPILVDFGKACLISEAKKKKLTKEEQARYRREHCHICPEVVDGTHPPSVKSDVYAFGVAIANCYQHCKYKPLKEIAKRCLSAFPSRCSSAHLQKIVDSFRQLHV